MAKDRGNNTFRRMERASAAPSLPSPEGTPGGVPSPTKSKVVRSTATTTVRRLGYVFHVTLGALVDYANSQGDHAFATELADALSDMVESLRYADFSATDVEGE